MSGRWPANVILSPEMAEVLDGQSGFSRSRVGVNPEMGRQRGIMGKKAPRPDAGKPMGHNDEGGASRFFLQAGYEPWELEWILANGLVPCGGTVYHGH